MKRFNFVLLVLLISGIGTALYADIEQYVENSQIELSDRSAKTPCLLSGDRSAEGSSETSMAEEAGKNRGFLFQIGMGATELSYGTQTDTYFASTTLYGLERMSLLLNLDLGWYIAGNSYLLLSLSGTGDRFEDNYGNYLQLNTYLLGPGVKYYPFGKGLSLGGCAGVSRAVYVSNIGVSGSSAVGYGLRLFAAYDLVNRYIDFGLDLGVSASYKFIEGAYVSNASLFLDLVWK